MGEVILLKDMSLLCDQNGKVEDWSWEEGSCVTLVEPDAAPDHRPPWPLSSSPPPVQSSDSPRPPPSGGGG